MARVEIKEPRAQDAHFGLYRTSAGGDEGIIVRRKVGDPTDTMHTKSRKLARTRANLALASQHYAKLTPSQKAITRRQFEIMPFIKSHGKSDTKLLMGRQLFIAREMRSLRGTGKQTVLPYELCIQLVDPDYNLLDGNFWLRYLKDEEWKACTKEHLSAGCWLFSDVPRDQEAYKVNGSAPGHFDPMNPIHQDMNQYQIRAYRYHILLPDDFGGSFTQDVHHAHSWHTFDPDNYVTYFHASHTLWTHAYTGELWFGISDYGDEHDPAKWKAKKTFTISLGDPHPSHYELGFGGLAYPPGSRFSYITWLVDWHWLIYWQGECWYWYI